jgi:hypothetical protein
VAQFPRLESHLGNVGFNTPAAAQALDGAAIQKLALQGMWVADKNWGNWSWNDNKTVCLRLLKKDGKCADTGTWNINGNVMCYKLTWWGKSYDITENCFTIQALKNNQYEALYHGGAMVSRFIKFTVIN